MIDDSDNRIDDESVIARLFELVRDGQIDNQEFALLDAVVQARLRQTYACNPEPTTL